MTTTQLSALLEAISEPAMISDETGTVIARNRAAIDSAWDGLEQLATNVEIQELGEGLRFARHKPVSDGAAHAVLEAAAQPAELDTLARGIVHEIRNPLAAILTAAKLVQDDPQVAEETAMLLGVIRKESLRINDILSEFSDYVRPRTPQLAVIDLTQIARETIAELRREEILSWSVTVEDALQAPLNAWADESHFHGALAHILQNAVDATELDATLRLWSHQANGKIIFCIDDNGPGFSTESLRRAFQPFYSTKSQSTGLGLSQAQASIQACGGRLWIENLAVSPALLSAPSATSQLNQAPDQTSRNGTAPHTPGARVCIELPLAPIQA